MPWCDIRDTRADPITEGSVGWGLILSAMDGQNSREHDAGKFGDEKKKQAVPSSRHNTFTQK